jgi:hypothetical protein
MLTRERVRQCPATVDGVLSLLGELGWPVAPIEVAPDEWRRAGIRIGWNGECRLLIASRLRRFDLFVLSGPVDKAGVSDFIGDYRRYNVATKSSLIHVIDGRLAIYDRAGNGRLRRLDVDLTEPTPHALDRLNLLAFGDEASLPRVFDRALDRDAVSRQFFQRFRAAVRDVAAALAECCPAETKESIDAEALLVLSRLLFLAFVQVKGWLNGERRFLVDRLERAIRDRREFYADVLVPLFFGCLNTPASERTPAARRLGRIPYLNGGLFEPAPFELRNTELHLPNGLMQRVVDELFERSDFSVDESDPAGTHVDPEMLGKVFESLMAEDERAASGSFYTPREIVDALTARAIEEWLRGTTDPHEALARLETITVLDPACGSGAFLLSALREIERLHRRFASEAGVAVPPNLRQRIVERSLYGVDLEPEAVRLCELRLWLAIVSTSTESIETIQPLPNLDRNIRQGSSLLSPTDFLGDARASIHRDWVYALRAQRELIERYRSAPRAERPALARLMRANDLRLATDLMARAVDLDEQELQSLAAPQHDLFGRALSPDLDACRKLQERIAENRRTLYAIEEGTLEFFSYDVHFAHVIAAGGFDIVAGNPPWVRNSRIDTRLKRMLRDRYQLFRGGDAAFHQPDLSLAFFERAVALAAPAGVVSLLMPAKMLNAGYAAPLRRFAQSKLTIVALDDWSDDPKKWFEADTFPMGITVRPCTETPPRAAVLHGVCVTVGGDSFVVEQKDLSFGDSWALIPPDAAAILRRICAGHPPLEESLARRPIMGVKTGRNSDFFLDAARISDGHFITADGFSIPTSAVSRCARGRDVRRWSAAPSAWMLWPPAHGWRRIPRWLERLAAARGIDPGELRLSYVRPEHVGIKVVWKDLSRGLCAAVLPDVVNVDGHAFPLVPNQTLYSIDAVSLDEAYGLAALLNSTVVDAFLLSVAERAKDEHYRYFGRTLARLPLPHVDRESEPWHCLVRLSRRAHLGTCVDADVDRLVASLYGVTTSELSVLRDLVERRLRC